MFALVCLGQREQDPESVQDDVDSEEGASDMAVSDKGTTFQMLKGGEPHKIACFSLTTEVID